MLYRKPYIISAPQFRSAFAFFISIYLSAYYIGSIKHSLIVLLCVAVLLLSLGLYQARFWRTCVKENIALAVKYSIYTFCMVLGLFMGHELRSRAWLWQNQNSLGMATEQVQKYFGRVLRDAVPIDEQKFRFTIQLFAASNNQQLLTSAQGQVLIYASFPNPMPALGQLVSVQAAIVELNSKNDSTHSSSSGSSSGPSSSSILFSRASKQSIQVFQSEDFSQPTTQPTRDLAEFPATKAAAYDIRSHSYSDRPAWERFWHKLWQQRSDLRNSLITSLNQLFPAAGRDLFLALLFGLSQDLPEQVKVNFRLSGASHILALSGFHVGILASIVRFLLRPLLGLRRALLVSCLILFSYLGLVGPLPSLTRAVFMFILLSGCQWFLRRSDGLNIWGLSALLQTQVFPTAAQTLSFQLSYAALLGLILFAGRGNNLALLLNYRLQRCLPQSGVSRLFSRLVQFMLQGMAITLAVLLCSAPILIANFGQIQWIGLFASLVETPIITLYMWLSLLFWPIAYLLQNNEALLTLLQTGYQQLYHVALRPMEFFAQAAPWQFYNTDGHIQMGALFLYIVISAILLAMLYRYEINRLSQSLSIETGIETGVWFKRLIPLRWQL